MENDYIRSHWYKQPTTMIDVGPGVRLMLNKLKVFSEENRISFDELELIRAGKATPIGVRDEHRLVIPVGYTIVFTINEDKDGWFRHLSITWLSGQNSMPVPGAIQIIMNVLGFKERLANAFVRIDDHKVIQDRDGFSVGVGSINVMEPLNNL